MCDQDLPVLASVVGSVGRLRLNRPKALNSLNLQMVELMTQHLQQWLGDDAISAVVVTSESDKAFCAGGDVRAVRDEVLADRPEVGDQFFQIEYRLNKLIADFAEQKPYVAVIDGIAMGGGLGISLHGSHRIVSQRASAAMPEMAIGFVPDVGVTWATQRFATQDGSTSQGVARFLGLTGYRLNAPDLLWSGWATHFVSEDQIDDFVRAIETDGVDAALERFAGGYEEAVDAVGQPSELAELRGCIEPIFAADTWLEMETALDNYGGGSGSCTREQINKINGLLRSASAMSLVAGAELYAANAKVDLATALQNEAQVGAIMIRHRNFAEGVRAVVVDKDRNARFDPVRADAVDPTPIRSVLTTN